MSKKKKKKTKTERQEGTQSAVQSYQAKHNGSGTRIHQQAGSLSELINQAITHMREDGQSESDAYKAITKATGLKLVDVHKVASNPNCTLRKIQQDTAIEGIEPLLKTLEG